MNRSQRGFTLVELMVAMMIFAVLTGSLYTIMFAGTRSSDTVRGVVRVSENGRLGLNRLVRDAREADEIATASDTSFNILVNFNNDFDGSGDPVYTNDPVAGVYEDLTVRYDPGTETIYLNDEPLVEGVTQIPGTPIFSFSSNVLEFDWDGNGVTTWEELDVAESDHGVNGVGDDNGTLSAGEWPFLSTVAFAFLVDFGDGTTEFHSQADLRNFVFAPVSGP